MKFRVRTLDRQALVFSLLVLITAAAKQTISKQCPQPSRRKWVANLEWLQLSASKKWSTMFYRKLSTRLIWYILWVMVAPPSFGPNLCLNCSLWSTLRLAWNVTTTNPTMGKGQWMGYEAQWKTPFSAKSFLVKLWLAVQKNSTNMVIRSAKSIYSTSDSWNSRRAWGCTVFIFSKHKIPYLKFYYMCTDPEPNYTRWYGPECGYVKNAQDNDLEWIKCPIYEN